MYIVLTILAELIFVSLLIILFYRLKPRFGLAPLYILLGVNQYFQTVLASSFYIKLFGELSISPGSIILFSSSLFAILFIYIKEGVRSTQGLIIGIVLANLSLTLLASITNLQEVVMRDIISSSGTAPNFFNTNFRIFFVGTVTLILDAFIIVILYEFFFIKVRRLGLFARLLITMLLVLNFDAVVFILGSFWGSADLWNKIASQVISKSVAAIFFAAVLWLYLRFLDKGRENDDELSEKKGMEDIFSILTYKGKFEKLVSDKVISDEELQKIIAEKTKELEKSIRRFTILSSVRTLRIDKYSASEQANEVLLIIKEAFEMDACTIHLVKGEELQMFSNVGIKENNKKFALRFGMSELKKLTRENPTFFLEDTSTKPGFFDDLHNGDTDFKYISCIGTALISGDEKIGLLKLYSVHTIRKFSKLEIEHLLLVANQIAHSIETGQLFEQNEKQKEILVKQIMARKKAAEETIKSNKRFELIGKAANDAVWEWNLDTNEFWGNEVLMNMYGLTMADPEPGDDEWKRRLHEEDKERMLKTIDNALASEYNSFEAEYRLFTENKGWINIYGRTYIERKADGKPIRMLGSIMDITERIKAEEEIRNTAEKLRELTTHLQNIREEERKRIGREIHDELGQQLTAIKMDVAWIDKKIKLLSGGNEELNIFKSKLKNTIELLDGSNLSIRRILNELRPVILDDNNLLEALDWIGRQFTSNTGVPFLFTCSETEIKLNEQLATCIFRVYQEALTNITRYARAKKVAASLTLIDNSIMITIADDGKGFEMTTVKNKKTFGILGMKERVLSLNGTFEINSSPGKGTTINLSLPFTV